MDKINFGAIVNKPLLNVIKEANKRTKNNPIERFFILKGLKRIKNAPFDNINITNKDNQVTFDFLAKYYIYNTKKDNITKRFKTIITPGELWTHFETGLSNTKDNAKILVHKLSRYLSAWDK